MPPPAAGPRSWERRGRPPERRPSPGRHGTGTRKGQQQITPSGRWRRPGPSPSGTAVPWDCCRATCHARSGRAGQPGQNGPPGRGVARRASDRAGRSAGRRPMPVGPSAGRLVPAGRPVPAGGLLLAGRLPGRPAPAAHLAGRLFPGRRLVPAGCLAGRLVPAGRPGGRLAPAGRRARRLLPAGWAARRHRAGPDRPPRCLHTARAGRGTADSDVPPRHSRPGPEPGCRADGDSGTRRRRPRCWRRSPANAGSAAPPPRSCPGPGRSCRSPGSRPRATATEGEARRASPG